MISLSAEGSIAIVDDSAVERMIISRVLTMSQLQNQVLEFSSAPAFLEHLDQRPAVDSPDFALVLMDINMPGMTGFDALPEIRKVRKLTDLLVAIMVASAEADHDIKRALDLGADLCIAKQSGIAKFVAEIDANFAPTDG